MADPQTACPGFASYRTLRDLRIEVNGQVPVYSLDSAQATKLRTMWGQYGAAVKAACKAHHVPAAWFMGIMLQESAGNPRACSPCDPKWCPALYPNCQPCCAFGLMQFIDQSARQYGTTGTALLGNAPLAIRVAAAYIADRIHGHPTRWKAPYGLDLVKVSAAYNAGRPRCSGAGTFGLIGQHDYSMSVARGANTALALGIPGWVNGKLRAMVVPGLLGGVVGALGAYAVYELAR